ncbi:MAG: cell division protein FtsZ [Alphaproteobacteria bacterium]
MLKHGTDKKELKPRIAVIGVGGAGGNAVNNMISSNLEGVEFFVCNTDAQALSQSLAEQKIQLGLQLTQGLGAGSKPDVGKGAAEESLEEILGHLKGTNMLFVTAGMGGGTGTGGAPVIASAAREMGILTVGVVTKPFYFEGSHRMRTADLGIEEMAKCVDTLLVIPNQNLFRVATEKTTFADAFAMADNILHSGVRTFTDLMTKHGLINLDFADISAVMREMMGKAMMGTGQASGERRAIEAAEAAISCPLLDDVTMRGARAVLINITGGLDMTLFEVDEAANRIREEVDPNANIIFGATFDETISGYVRVSVVATGIDAKEQVVVSASPSKEAQPASSSVLRSALFSIKDKPVGENEGEKISEPDLASLKDLASLQAKQNDEEALIAPFEEQTWGRKHDLFSFDYTQNSSIADDLREAESPFQAGRSALEAEGGYGLKEGSYEPSASVREKSSVEPVAEKPKKNLSFFEKLAGVARRGSGAETAASSLAQKPETTSGLLEKKAFGGSYDSPLTPEANASGENSAEFDQHNLDIPAFLRYQKGQKK